MSAPFDPRGAWNAVERLAYAGYVLEALGLAGSLGGVASSLMELASGERLEGGLWLARDDAGQACATVPFAVDGDPQSGCDVLAFVREHPCEVITVALAEDGWRAYAGGLGSTEYHPQPSEKGAREALGRWAVSRVSYETLSQVRAALRDIL